MPDDKLKYDALIESKSWDTLTEEEVTELASAGIGREEYEIIRSTFKGFGGLSDPDEGITMRPEVRAGLMEMFDAGNKTVNEETDPRIIRIRYIRRLYTAAAAAAAVILVVSVWWLASRDNSVDELNPAVEIAQHTTQKSDAPGQDVQAQPQADQETISDLHEKGAEISVPVVSGISETEAPINAGVSSDLSKASADDTKIVADALIAEGKDKEEVVKGTKAVNLSSKKLTVEAYSEPSSMMDVRSDFRLSKQGASGKGASGSSAGRSSGGRPASEDAELLRFLYACR